MECPRCTTERWKYVTGFERYQISNHGRLYRPETGRFLCPGRLRRGHLRATLYRKGQRATFQVHHLVLLEFVGRRPPDLEGIHNNDDPSDNCFKNLRWGTHSENMLDAVINGRMPNVHGADVKEAVVAAVGSGSSVFDESHRHGIPWRTIYDWLREAGVHRPKPTDEKTRIVGEILKGTTVKDAAVKYGVSQRSIYRWLADERNIVADAYDCGRCGACCASPIWTDTIADLDQRDLKKTKKLSEATQKRIFIISIRGARVSTGMKRDRYGNFVCNALRGSVNNGPGQSRCSCSIYEARPMVCCAFRRGSRLCRDARQEMEVTDA